MTDKSPTPPVVAANDPSPRSSSNAKNPYAFFHELINILSELSVTFRISIPEQNSSKQEASSAFHIEAAPQNVRKIIDALTQAEELQKEVEAAANADLVQKLNQANREISARISQELPTMVLLAFIEDYCQKQTRTLTQMEQQRRVHIRRGENLVVGCLLVWALFMAYIGVFFILWYYNPTLFLLLLIPGLCLELIGMYCLWVNAARRRKLNEILQWRTSLHRLRMMPLMLEEIADQEEKQAMMQAILFGLLNHTLRANFSC